MKSLSIFSYVPLLLSLHICKFVFSGELMMSVPFYKYSYWVRYHEYSVIEWAWDLFHRLSFIVAHFGCCSRSCCHLKQNMLFSLSSSCDLVDCVAVLIQPLCWVKGVCDVSAVLHGRSNITRWFIPTHNTMRSLPGVTQPQTLTYSVIFVFQTIIWKITTSPKSLTSRQEAFPLSYVLWIHHL